MSEEFYQNALRYHRYPTPGKLSVQATKPLATQYDLSLAYSPGVAAACREIERDPREACNYTAKGNLVAVISNGTAVLGLGAIGASASKPVMEGKAVLFKKFAGIDVFDIEINERDPDRLVNIIASLEPTFGAINLEDIKAPECFIVERKLKERMGIPVFHDDQHGTAVCVGAALLNGLRLLGKRAQDIKLVTSGAGAAALACLDLLVELGVRPQNIIVTDIDGVVYLGREVGMDEFKARYAVDTPARTLADALAGADVFLGLSAAHVLKPEMLARMVERPLIFALANPVPEIMPAEARTVRPLAIIATGRSDYPNQVNNVLCFPFIFRGALDVGASEINQAMKLACVQAIADLAYERAGGMAAAETSEILHQAYGSQELVFGADYLIPKPFDPRLIAVIPPAVARAAMDSGVASRPIADFAAYQQSLSRLMFRSANMMKVIFDRVKARPQRLIFSEGEDERVLRAVQVLLEEGCCASALLLGRRAVIEERIRTLGLSLPLSHPSVRIVDTADCNCLPELATEYHNIMGRRGVWPAEAEVAVRTNSTVMAALMLRRNEADALIVGPVGSFREHLRDAVNVIGLQPGVRHPAGMQMLILDKGTYFIADTAINYDPSAEQLAEITVLAARQMQRFGMEPKAALVSHSNFGSTDHPSAVKLREVLALLQARMPELECDGEMQADAALREDVRLRLFPHTPLRGEANLLIMPNLDAANITFSALRALADGEAVGPILLGMGKSVHLLGRSSTTRNIVHLSLIATLEAHENQDNYKL